MLQLRGAVLPQIVHLAVALASSRYFSTIQQNSNNQEASECISIIHILEEKVGTWQCSVHFLVNNFFFKGIFT